jgi:hypothetical protein
VLRRSLLLAAVLAAVPASSLADGFMPAADPNADLAAPGGRLVVSPRPHTGQTLVTVSGQDGRQVARRMLPGHFGVPVVTFPGQLAGFAADGRTFVLAGVPPAYPAKVSHLAVLDPQLRAEPRMLTFRGDYAFDAISPRGRLLYLIQHVSRTDLWAYQVRVYDLQAGRLRPQPIVDRVEHEWRMSGTPLQRLTTADGVHVYTLYLTSKGTVFVHALNAAQASARCIDLPWKDTSGTWAWRLRLQLGESGLEMYDAGRVVASIDTRANRVVRADRAP